MKVVFLHRGGEGMASYRYRVKIPVQHLGDFGIQATINKGDADVLVLSKPHQVDVMLAKGAQSQGCAVVVDFCDDHFDRLPYYAELTHIAQVVTCPTPAMAALIKRKTGVEAQVVTDPYEFPERTPHCNGARLLWYGNKVNLHSLKRLMPLPWPVKIVSDAQGALPWSLEAMPDYFATSDICLMPHTADYKSPNRTVEAVRQGCFVVAEPHPSLVDIPGIWRGDIKEGVEWAIANLKEANERTAMAQAFARNLFHPKTVASAWNELLRMARSRLT